MYHLKQNAEMINLYVIQPAGIMGTHTQEVQQAIRATWNEFFKLIPVTLKHWDSLFY